jgi:hypothetical protein
MERGPGTQNLVHDPVDLQSAGLTHVDGVYTRSVVTHVPTAYHGDDKEWGTEVVPEDEAVGIICAVSQARADRAANASPAMSPHKRVERGLNFDNVRFFQ